MEKLQTRRGEMTDMVNPGSGRVRIEFKIPTRGLFGIRTEFLTETRGTGLLYHTFLEYGPYRGEIAGRNRGALISKEAGDTTAYAIEPLQERTVLFVSPGSKSTAARSSAKTPATPTWSSRSAARTPHQHARLRLRHGRPAHPPEDHDSRQCLEWIEDDELVEVTTQSIRIRKRILDHSMRVVAQKKPGVVRSLAVIGRSGSREARRRGGREWLTILRRPPSSVVPRN